MIFSLFLFPVEKIINFYLALDPETPRRLVKLKGKTVLVKSVYLGALLYFSFEENKIILKTKNETVPDVTLSGTPFDFLRLGTRGETSAVLESEMKMEGDVITAEKFKALFSELEIDWEEQLSKVTGDVLAHQIGNFLKSFQAWTKNAKENVMQNTTEYLQEEVRLLPPHTEAEIFFQDVDRLRDDVERLVQRIGHITS